MGKDAQILAILADGRFRSGQELAQQLGLSRSGIWKVIQTLQDKGIEIFAVQGKGYRLAHPVELLAKNHIRQIIAEHNPSFPGEVMVLWETDSTNRYLSQQCQTDDSTGNSCLAETQTAGRGRRGRTWVSPLGGNVYLSQLWRFNGGPANLSGLSLAAAIAVVEAIQQLGVKDVGLKWPNDVLANGKKLAGILLEINGESNGPTNVVVGVGVNVRLPDAAREEIDQPAVSLEALLGRNIERNQFAAYLVCKLYEIYEKFSERGFPAFIDQWHEYDVYLNQKIQLSLPAGNIVGVNRGVNQSGSLQIEYDGQIYSYQSGELSMRAHIAN